MKRTACKKCGKGRWAHTEGKGERSRFTRALCLRCRTRAFGSQEPRKVREKRVKRKRRGVKPSGKKKDKR